MYGSFHFHSPWIHFSVGWISVHRNLLKGQRNDQGVPQTKINLPMYTHYIRKCNNLKNTRLCKGKWIFSIDFMLWNQLSEIKSSNKNLNVGTMNILSNWIKIFGTSRSFKGISILALYHPCSVHEKQTAL